MIINVGHPEDSDELEQVLDRGPAHGVRARRARPDRSATNTLLLASDRDRRRTRLRAAAARPTAPAAARARGARGGSRPGLRGGTVYTDDRRRSSG